MIRTAAAEAQDGLATTSRQRLMSPASWPADLRDALAIAVIDYVLTDRQVVRQLVDYQLTMMKKTASRELAPLFR